MRLNLKELQALDILLKNFTSRESICSSFNIVIKIDNQLWQGNFVYFENDTIKEYYLDSDGDLECKTLYTKDFILLYENFTYGKYVHILNSINEDYSKSLILKEFVKAIKNSSLKDFEPYRILYNAVNLTTNTKLPFINLSSDEYEVVSLIRN